jgi:hypothetical protein
MATLSRRGALQITGTLDHVAQVIQQNHAVLGIDAKIATDFAYRCDLLSDAIEKKAGVAKKADYYKGDNETGLSVEPPPADGFDANNLGDVHPEGPLLLVDSDEPWMKGEFTQEEFSTLRDLQQDGDLGPVAIAVKAKLAALQKQMATLAGIVAKLG